MTRSLLNFTAQVAYPPFWRLNTVPPVLSIISLFYRFSERCVSCLSSCQLTWNDLTSCLASAVLSADNYYDIILHHNSCMLSPLFAEKGIEMRGKVVGNVRWECLTSGWDLSWLETWEWFERLKMNGNLTSVCGSLSSPLAHPAKRCKKSGWRCRHKPQVVFLGLWQRGSGPLSLGRRMDKRLIITRGEVTFARKRRDQAVGLSWEGFDASCSSLSSSNN